MDFTEQNPWMHGPRYLPKILRVFNAPETVRVNSEIGLTWLEEQTSLGRLKLTTKIYLELPFTVQNFTLSALNRANMLNMDMGTFLKTSDSLCYANGPRNFDETPRQLYPVLE
jgi:hypothetical protein